MTAQHKKSYEITELDSAYPDIAKLRGYDRIVKTQKSVYTKNGSTDADGTTIIVGRVPANSSIQSVKIAVTGTATGLSSVAVGLYTPAYNSTIGTVIDVDCIKSSLNAGSGVSETELITSDALRNKKAIELATLPSDKTILDYQAEVDIVVTLTTAGTASPLIHTSISYC